MVFESNIIVYYRPCKTSFKKYLTDGENRIKTHRVIKHDTVPCIKVFTKNGFVL